MNPIKTLFRIANKVIFIAIVAIIIVFCFNNRQIVEISLSPLPFTIETRLFLVVLLCIFGGILIGFLSSSVALLKEKFKNFIGRWKIKFLERKVKKEMKVNTKLLSKH